MGQAIVLNAPGAIGFEAYTDRALEPHEVRVRTLYSGISAGTELTSYRGGNVYLHKRRDQALRLCAPREELSGQHPVRDLGCEESGEVIEAGSAVTRMRRGCRRRSSWAPCTCR